MVDYSSALPQQQFFQPPDMLQNAMRVQQIQALQQKTARDAQLKQLYARPDFDTNSPDAIRQLGLIGGPELAMQAITSARQNENLQRQTALATAQLANQNRELIAKHGEEFQRNLRMVDAYPMEQRPEAYGRLVSSLPPDLQTVFPRQYSPDAVRRGMSTTTQLLDAAKPQYQMFDGVPVAVTPETGTFTPLREAGVGAPVAGVGAPAVNNALAARAGAPMGGAGAPAMPGAGAAPAGFDMNRAKQAIAGIESGGRYGALGPVTNRGDRAFGKYQVMGANIPSWTKEALGRSMTPAEFLASPEAQERVFETQFGKSVAKYGNPADAASVWFSGRPLAKAGNASDVLGTTVPQYAQKFMAAYEGGANTPAMMRAPGFASSSGIPANVGLPTAPVLNALAGPQPAQQGNALAAPMLQQQPPAPAPTTFEEMQRAANARNLEKQRAIETMKAQVAAEAPPRAMTAQQERSMLNTVSKDRLSAETTIGTMDDVLKAVKDVQDLTPKQKESVTGITAKLPPVFADSRTARTKLDNLKGVVTQMGKRVASLGGAIGNMAVAEWKIVSDAIASLDTTNMNTKDLNDQLDIIAAKANAAAARTKDAYERQYEELKTKHGTRFDLSGGAAATTAKVPAIGATDSGYRFKGGDPAKADSWEKI